MTAPRETVAAIRRFNRFYTRAIGVLERRHVGSPYTLAETRTLYEIATAGGIAPKAVGERLGLDPGYLSRILKKLERDGLVRREPSDVDGRSVVLTPTDAGAALMAKLGGRSEALVAAMIDSLSEAEQAELTAAMRAVERLLASPADKPPAILRPHEPGDMGWVVERHAVIYGREYGWGPGIEALTAGIVAEFLERHDPARERCWIAERDGQRLGSVFLVRESDEVARLRLLILDPAGRGEGLGRRLVETCVAFAREAGYREIVLWTHEVLTAARKIYADLGFTLEETWTHDDFGKVEVGETWRLKL